MAGKEQEQPKKEDAYLLFKKAEKLKEDGNSILAKKLFLDAYNIDPSINNYQLSLFAGEIYLNMDAGDRDYATDAAEAFQKALSSTSEDIRQYARDKIAEINAEATKVSKDTHLIQNLHIEIPKEKFSDVIGLEKAKKLLEKYIIRPMAEPQRYKDSGINLQKAVLLYGAPGVGKTYLAKAIAGEAGVNYTYINIGEIFGMYSGVSEKNLLRIYSEAKKNAPIILFFDEFDALGQKRKGIDTIGEGDVQQRLVNQLLQLIGNQEYEGVYTIAATNYPWQIDAALRRAGRIGNMIYLQLPSKREREQLFSYYAKGSNINTRRLASATAGYTPADIKAIVEDTIYERLDKGGSPELSTNDLLNTIKAERQESPVLIYFARVQADLKFKVSGRKALWKPDSPIAANERKLYKDMLIDIYQYGTEKSERRNSLFRRFAMRMF